MGKGSITLHKTLGVNPRLTTCTQCGKDGEEIVLLGQHNYEYRCPACDITVFGGGKCPKCGGHLQRGRELGKWERLPVGLCKECREEREEYAKVVAEGGVYWKCRDCGKHGVIRKSPFADEVRKAHGKDGQPLTTPCGVEFNKNDKCPVCGPDAVKEGTAS